LSADALRPSGPAGALRSFKLNFAERRVRVVPATLTGPGVDLVGDDAVRALGHAAPLLAWFEALEPGTVVRSFSWDARGPRVLATLEATPKPRVVRIDGSPAADLVARAPALLAFLSDEASTRLARRGRHEG